MKISVVQRIFLSLSILTLTLSSQTFAANTANLTAEEQEVLSQGEIPKGRWIPGGIVGTAVGFGIGHAITGQYKEMGWVFTATEVPAYAVMVSGLVLLVKTKHYSNGERKDPSALAITLTAAGAIAFTGLRIWEIVDIWTRPQNHNEQYRSIKAKLQADSGRSNHFALIPTISPDKEFGAALAFNF